jgi:hypothetical protein
MDFYRELTERVSECDVFLAVIGQGWSDLLDDNGELRLNNPDDWVRIEIEAALQQEKLLIPVLVNAAKMPDPKQLPKSLAPFTRRQAARITHDRFRTDVRGLVEIIKALRAETAKAKLEAEEQRQREADKQKKEAEEARRREAEERQKREAEERQRKEAEEQRQRAQKLEPAVTESRPHFEQHPQTVKEGNSGATQRPAIAQRADFGRIAGDKETGASSTIRRWVMGSAAAIATVAVIASLIWGLPKTPSTPNASMQPPSPASVSVDESAADKMAADKAAAEQATADKARADQAAADKAAADQAAADKARADQAAADKATQATDDPTARATCTAEFTSKKSSGDLGPNANKDGFIRWCVQNPIKAVMPSGTRLSANARQASSGRSLSSCKAELVRKKANGDLGRNPDEDGFLAWCTSNP